VRPDVIVIARVHAELGGKILENRQEAESLREQMRHVEAVIKMLVPDYNLNRITVKRRQTGKWFKRGTLYRRAVDVLRTATEPITATDLAWGPCWRLRAFRPTIRRPSRYWAKASRAACGIMPGKALSRSTTGFRLNGH
jgi:hypothetical protein